MNELIDVLNNKDYFSEVAHTIKIDDFANGKLIIYEWLGNYCSKILYSVSLSEVETMGQAFAVLFLYLLYDGQWWFQYREAKANEDCLNISIVKSEDCNATEGWLAQRMEAVGRKVAQAEIWDTDKDEWKRCLRDLWIPEFFPMIDDAIKYELLTSYEYFEKTKGFPTGWNLVLERFPDSELEFVIDLEPPHLGCYPQIYITKDSMHYFEYDHET